MGIARLWPSDQESRAQIIRPKGYAREQIWCGHQRLHDPDFKNAAIYFHTFTHRSTARMNRCRNGIHQLIWAVQHWIHGPNSSPRSCIRRFNPDRSSRDPRRGINPLPRSRHPAAAPLSTFSIRRPDALSRDMIGST
jgi:hypothetical protein